MAMDDLFQALNMFKQGAQELGVGNAIRGANQAVQDLKASTMKEEEKRAQLQSISNGLVAHLAGIGAPATTLQAVAGAIGPKQYANSNQMNLEGVLTGNEKLRDAAATQQEFEQNPEYKLQLLRAKMEAGQNGLKQQQLLDERFAKHIEGLDKRVDTQMARFGNIAKLQQVNNTIADARKLMDGNIYNLNITEVAKTLDRILSQAAPTMSGVQEITPHTLAQTKAKIAEYITSKPQKVDIPQFMEFYRKTLDRIEGVNTKIISGAQRQAIQAVGPTFARMNQEGFKAWAAARTGEDVTIDPNTGRIEFSGTKSSYGQQGSAPQAAPPAAGPSNDISKYIR